MGGRELGWGGWEHVRAPKMEGGQGTIISICPYSGRQRCGRYLLVGDKGDRNPGGACCGGGEFATGFDIEVEADIASRSSTRTVYGRA